MRAALAAAVLIALSGCETSVAAIGAPTGEGARALALYGGDIVATAPYGYCADTEASRPSLGFALFAGCGLISALDIMPTAEALLSIQVGQAGSAAVTGQEGELAGLLLTEAGAALLSEDGNGAEVEVDDVQPREGIVFVHFTDESPPPAPGIETREWRAFFDVKGRLVTIALRGLARAPLSTDGGLGLLESAAETFRAANTGSQAGAE
ncbi:dihydroxy-acid dehydratase [Pseudoroseicyclus tamaricis]|uniref:Dihydroxy-acid dehydratase n=1 Tax=Pseudoroseicyclus tamaricis TaxID=2705421 RepID=A0A6B2JNB0_9RHOB|nr:dihydroxy-acid dehydratase [Pseudoroseicyclus tamaricis]NDU99517.1 dihydroxy-acid dehydratase [Pseudoroseicyclus tamaricis]